MTDPEISVRIQGTRLSPPLLTNSINIIIHTKSDEILLNPNTASFTFSGRTIQISPPFVVNFDLHNTNHPDIFLRRILLHTNLNTSSLLYDSLASEISMAATDLGFGFNGFFMNVFITVTYYHHTVELVTPSDPSPPANLNNTEELYRMVLEGRIKKEVESLKTESCSICLDDLYDSNSKKGLTRMTCSHVFHNRCLFEWLRCKNTCPLCRTVLYHR